MLYTNKHEDQLTPLMQVDYLRTDPLQVLEVENGLFLPLRKLGNDGPLMGNGGVLDQDGKYISLSAQVGKGDTRDRFNGTYEFDAKAVEERKETVLYMGAFPAHWGHFLVDFVSRAWYLPEANPDLKIVYTSEQAAITGVYMEFFRLLGIEASRFARIVKPTRFHKILVPEVSYMACSYYTDAFRTLFDRVCQAAEQEVDATPYDKIYMSRGHFKEAASKELGESSIEQNFEQNGYKLLYMEELSLAEQAFYVRHCKQLAALSGTLCHNVVFGTENTELIFLNKTNIINTHQILIDQMIGCSVKRVDVFREPYEKYPVSYGQGPFLLSSRKLKTLFTQYGYRLQPESTPAEWKKLIQYTIRCWKLSLARGYEKLYHTLNRYDWFMKPFRIARGWIVGK